MKPSTIAALATGIACLSSVPALARDSLQAAIWLPPTHQVGKKLYEDWAEQVEKYSDGTFTVDVDLGSSMVSPRGAMAELADGIVDVSLHVAQYTPTELALSNALEELGMRYSDPRVVLAASTDFSINAPEMQAEWERNGIVFGGGYVTAPYRLFCNKPIVTLDDVKGAKLRLPGRSPAAWANSVGAVTVALDSNEQYGALDKGALTCTATTMSEANSRKLYEVAKYVTDLPVTLFWAGYAWAYNPWAWDDLSADQRRALFDAEADALAAYVVQGIGEEEADVREKLVAAGVTFAEPDAPLTASINAFRDSQAQAAVTVAEETYRIKDAKDILARFGETVAKWDGILATVSADDEKAYADALRTEIFDKIDVATYPSY